MTDTQALVAKLQALPPEQLLEVEDFVDFIASKVRRREALQRLLAMAPAMEAAGAEALSEDEIFAEVKAVRVARRAKADMSPAGEAERSGADRT